MRQALHIFKKDVRHLWFEIVLTLLIAAAFTFTGVRRARWLMDPGANQGVAWQLVMFLMPLAWWTLIARVIHSEALPGDRQFWLTRPYAWKSLLGAKAIFIVVFVNIPLLVADALIIRAYGFSLTAELPGLLWSQVLLTTVVVLPTAALSAVTTGFVQLLVTSLVVYVAVLAWNIAAPEAAVGDTWRALEWVKSTYAIVVITVAALAIVAWQYARRRTGITRSLAAAASVLVGLGIAFLPWAAAFGIQSRLSRQRVDPSSVRVGFDSARKWAARALIDKDDRVRIDVPLQITGVPAGMEAKFDGLIVTIETPDGPAWRADQHPWSNVTSTGQAVSLLTVVDGSFYRKVKNAPVKLRGSLYLTLYGNRRTAAVPFNDRPVSVPGAGLCSASRDAARQNYFLLCSSAFRAQPDIVSIRFVELGKATYQEARHYGGSPRQAISYSPFPADLSISPVSQYFAYSTFQGPLSAVIVDALEPLAHIRREFEISDLRLGEFEVRL